MRKAEFVVADKIDEIIRLFRNVLEIKEIDFTCDLQNTSSITADPELFASIIGATVK